MTDSDDPTHISRSADAAPSIELLAHIPLFATLPPAHLAELLRLASVQTYGPQAPLQQAADLVQASIVRAHALVQQFKKLSVAEVADTLERLNIVEALEAIVGLFALTARQAQLEIHLHHALAREQAEWVGYRGALSQIVLNLLTNVQHYAYPGGAGGVVEIEVGQGAATGEPVFVLEVRDVGVGILPEVLPRVFDPFFTTDRPGGGTGLGLAIVHSLATSVLGGSVRVASAPGRGTPVHLEFPQRILDKG